MLLFIYIVVLSTVDSAVRVVVRFVVHNTESAITEEFSMGGEFTTSVLWNPPPPWQEFVPRSCRTAP